MGWMERTSPYRILPGPEEWVCWCQVRPRACSLPSCTMPCGHLKVEGCAPGRCVAGDA